MTIRLVAVATVAALAFAAPATVFAQGAPAPGHPAWQQRSIDNSAKEGNASQPERAVPQYGSTAGGPAS